jgi:hypothetical protein
MPKPITCMSCELITIIDTRDGHDLVNVIFQSKHLNRIIVGLEPIMA